MVIILLNVLMNKLKKKIFILIQKKKHINLAMKLAKHVIKEVMPIIIIA